MAFPVVMYGCKSHLWMWDKESWALKNWCFWTVVLEKTVESPRSARTSNQSILNEIGPGYSLEGMMPKLKLQYFGHLMRWVDSLEDFDAGRDWGQEEKGTTEDEMAGWHFWLDDMSLVNSGSRWWTRRPGMLQSWSHRELDTTEWLNWTELNTRKGVLFLPSSDVYVGSFLYLVYSLIKLYYTKALRNQALSLTLDWIFLLWKPRIPASLSDSAATFQIYTLLDNNK